MKCTPGRLFDRLNIVILSVGRLFKLDRYLFHAISSTALKHDYKVIKLNGEKIASLYFHINQKLTNAIITFDTSLLGLSSTVYSMNEIFVNFNILILQVSCQPLTFFID